MEVRRFVCTGHGAVFGTVAWRDKDRFPGQERRLALSREGSARTAFAVDFGLVADTQGLYNSWHQGK